MRRHWSAARALFLVFVLALAPLISGTFIGPNQRLIDRGGLTETWIFGDTHIGCDGSTTVSVKLGILSRHARQNGVKVMIDGGDITCLMNINYDGGNGAMGAWKSWLKDSLPGVEVFGLPNNHDFATDRRGQNGRYNTGYTRADSTDPLWVIRQICPYLDAWGNYAFTRGNNKFIVINNWFHASASDSCHVGDLTNLWVTPFCAHGADCSDTSYQSFWPSNTLPTWNLKGSSMWNWAVQEIRTADVPFIWLVLGENLVETQSSNLSGYMCWGQDQATRATGDTTTFGDMLEMIPSSQGYHVSGVFGFHAHHTLVTKPMLDGRPVTFAAGGIIYCVGPHEQQSHCGADSVWRHNGLNAPDTCKSDSSDGFFDTSHYLAGNCVGYHDRQDETKASNKCPWHIAIRPSGWTTSELCVCDSTDKVLYTTGTLKAR